MKTYLAFDTSTEACSVALWHQGQCFTRQSDQMNQTHTQSILPWFQECLDEAGCVVSEVRALACTVGPGSFTGVRLGVAIAQALSFAQTLPVLGVTTLQLLAMQAPQNAKKVLAMLDARMGQIYWGHFERDERQLMQLKGNLKVSFPQELDEIINQQQDLFLLGSGIDAYLNHWALSPEQYQIGIKPHAEHLFLLLDDAVLNHSTVTAYELTPVYVRDSII